MPGLLWRMFRRRAAVEKGAQKPVNGTDLKPNGVSPAPIDPWEKTSVRREDVVELLKACCDELKQRGALVYVFD